jgi:hypothetical protein
MQLRDGEKDSTAKIYKESSVVTLQRYLQVFVMFNKATAPT